jgi:hypothetical protein
MSLLRWNVTLWPVQWHSSTYTGHELKVNPEASEYARETYRSALFYFREVCDSEILPRSTGEVEWRVWEESMLLPDHYTVCWCTSLSNSSKSHMRFTPENYQLLSSWVYLISANISETPVVYCLHTLHGYSKYHTVYCTLLDRSQFDQFTISTEYSFTIQYSVS